MLQALISPLFNIVSGIIDKVLPDTKAAEDAKNQLFQQLVTMDNTALQGAIDIVKAEAQGESWLQRNWRPILMLVVVAIIANNYILAPYINALFGANSVPMLDLPDRLWDLMTLGVGGYVAGRSAEKIVDTFKNGSK